ncbi:MAG: hypothetical protein KDE00_06800 [Rhodobacteraceae bacterium]|nr:hypothetical protein [Paracoccaceae bacterium]
MIRPELRVRLHRWREVIAAGMALAFGLWVAAQGGLVLTPLGLALAALALGWGVVALRRLRFQLAVGAPGIVEVDEGQVGYFGPSFGGFVSLSDLAELRLTEFHGKRQWRLRTLDGQVLSVPIDAAGAERLFDAFASLPGIDMAALTAALGHGQATLPLWTRPRAALARG